MQKIIDYLSSELEIKNKNLLENDIILHSLLSDLINNDYFRKNFAFKGGTCLTKCYYGYFRFSEDLDFTWIKQKDFENVSQKEIRKILSKHITKLGRILEEISEKLNLNFKTEKHNKKYVESGGSNKFTTFKLWYKSVISNREQFIKIQINFLELFHYPFKTCKANSIVRGIDSKEFDFLFPKYAKILVTKPEISCYDIREIITEKFRAILTRKGVKARDFIDLFLISKKENIDPKNLTKKLEKTRFMLRYNKYIQNLQNFKLEKFVLGEEEKLLLTPIPRGFEKFLEKVHKLLNELAEELMSDIKSANPSTL